MSSSRIRISIGHQYDNVVHDRGEVEIDLSSGFQNIRRLIVGRLLNDKSKDDNNPTGANMDSNWRLLLRGQFPLDEKSVLYLREGDMIVLDTVTSTGTSTIKGTTSAGDGILNASVEVGGKAKNTANRAEESNRKLPLLKTKVKEETRETGDEDINEKSKPKKCEKTAEVKKEKKYTDDNNLDISSKTEMKIEQKLDENNAPAASDTRKPDENGKEKQPNKKPKTEDRTPPPQNVHEMNSTKQKNNIRIKAEANYQENRESLYRISEPELQNSGNDAVTSDKKNCADKNTNNISSKSESRAALKIEETTIAQARDKRNFIESRKKRKLSEGQKRTDMKCLKETIQDSFNSSEQKSNTATTLKARHPVKKECKGCKPKSSFKNKDDPSRHGKHVKRARKCDKATLTVSNIAGTQDKKQAPAATAQDASPLNDAPENQNIDTPTREDENCEAEQDRDSDNNSSDSSICIMKLGETEIAFNQMLERRWENTPESYNIEDWEEFNLEPIIWRVRKGQKYHKQSKTQLYRDTDRNIWYLKDKDAALDQKPAAGELFDLLPEKIVQDIFLMAISCLQEHHCIALTCHAFAELCDRPRVVAHTVAVVTRPARLAKEETKQIANQARKIASNKTSCRKIGYWKGQRGKTKKASGLGVWIGRNCTLPSYAGNFHAGLADGFVNFVDENANEYWGEMKKGKKHGVGVSLVDEFQLEGSFVKDKRHGYLLRIHKGDEYPFLFGRYNNDKITGQHVALDFTTDVVKLSF